MSDHRFDTICNTVIAMTFIVVLACWIFREFRGKKS